MPPQELDVPWQTLEPETLERLVSEFVTRDGTDYGQREASLESKIGSVIAQLKSGKIRIVFDPESQTCDIREAIAGTSSRS